MIVYSWVGLYLPVVEFRVVEPREEELSWPVPFSRKLNQGFERERESIYNPDIR